MANFLSRLFGRNEKGKGDGDAEQMIVKALDGIIENANFELDFEVQPTEEGFFVNFSGNDGSLVTSKEGLLLDSFQIFLKRMLQNKFPDKKIEIAVDCEGFMESSAQELRELAEKLKSHVLEKGGTSYVRALPPRERKIVHRYLADDARVRSQSIGDGFCKKIKISLAEESAPQRRGRRPSPETTL